MSIAKENLRAVVTGAGSGIGRAFALDVARRRGSVLCADIDLARAEETVALVEAAGGRASATRCDVAKLEDVTRLADEADARIGGADLIVNNAGVAVGGMVGQATIEDWRWLMEINLWGVVYGCHVFVPRFRAQRRGHVINVASAAGIVAGPRMGPYNVAKAGVIALSETLASELHGSGVGVTVLCPSFIKTNLLDTARGQDEAGKEMARKLMERGTHTAEQVAAITMEAAEAGEVYCLPQADARWMWRLKRLHPTRFYKTLAPRISKLVGDGKTDVDFRSIARGLFKDA